MEAAVGAAIRDIDDTADGADAVDCCFTCLPEAEVGRGRVGFGESDLIVSLSIVKDC